MNKQVKHDIKNLLRTGILLFLVTMISNPGVKGQNPWVQQFAPTPAQRDAHCGWDVSLTDNWAFIASPNFTLYEHVAAGKVEVYRWTENEWQYFGEIFAPEPASHEYFGFSISSHENELVVGAVGNSAIDYMAGCVYYYKFDGEKWGYGQQLIPEGLTGGAELGFDVEIDDKHILAGAPFAAGSNSNSGVAYLFSKETGNWNLQKKLFNTIDNKHTGFGTRVALGNGLVFVGTVYHNPDGTRTGTVLSFEREGENTKQVQVFSPETTSKCDCFGSAFLHSGELLIIGARNGDSDIEDHGYVSCYKWNGERYEFLQTFTAPVKEKKGLFGVSLAMFDNYLFVGATGSEVNGYKDAGRVLVYRFENERFVFEMDITGIIT